MTGVQLADLAKELHETKAERDRYRAALQSMLSHVCDGGGERPCSQMWFQDVAEEALASTITGQSIPINGNESAPSMGMNQPYALDATKVD